MPAIPCWMQKIPGPILISVKEKKYHYLVVLNFSSKQAEAYPGIDMQGAEILMCNYGDSPQLDKVLSLRPYEAVVMRSEEFGG